MQQTKKLSELNLEELKITAYDTRKEIKFYKRQLKVLEQQITIREQLAPSLPQSTNGVLNEDEKKIKNNEDN